jgi:cytochrome c biogenesis protein CcdA
MTFGLLGALGGIALLDSLNPSLFITQFFLFSLANPVRRIAWYTIGAVLAYFIGGLLVLLGFRTLFGQVVGMVSGGVWAWLSVGLGALLLFYGWRYQPKIEPLDKSLPIFGWPALVLGMVMTGNEVTTALPYFVAIERMAQAGLTLPESLGGLLWYNLIFSLPLWAFWGAFIIYRQQFTAQLGAITRWMETWLPRITKWAMLILGVLLVGYGLWSLLMLR